MSYLLVTHFSVKKERKKKPAVGYMSNEWLSDVHERLGLARQL